MNYPLLNRLLQIPGIRQRYIAHAKTILEDSFNDTVPIGLIDNLAALIDEKVRLDPKTFTTYGRFRVSVDTLKGFIEQREHFIKSDDEMSGVSPVIENTKFAVNNVDWEVPDADEPVVVTTNATHPSGIKEMNLFYGTGFFGNFEKVQMEGNGSIYTARLEGFNPGDYVRFYIEAVASDGIGSRSYSPAGAEHDVFLFRVNISEVASSDVVINEFMVSNDITFADEEGEFDDWLELYNTSLIDVPLDGYYLSDNSGDLFKWDFPDGIVINANGYLIVWADDDEGQPGLHTNFKLSASGEELFLVNNHGQIADQMN
ncbi:MAG: lamin tail domain-containing protein [Bacteroidales bacterium]|nr:lamin tail domain-containing protein [Bacteroidales bacterium]